MIHEDLGNKCRAQVLQPNKPKDLCESCQHGRRIKTAYLKHGKWYYYRHPFKTIRLVRSCIWCIYSDDDKILKLRGPLKVIDVVDNYLEIK